MSKRTIELFLLFSLLIPGFAIPAVAGETESAAAASIGGRSQAELNASPIQDNSFPVEEAYNQEDGVVQHISFFERLATGEWAFTQTDEWPLRSLKHQLSLTMTAAQPGDNPGAGAGWGDTFINYRYQLVGSGEAKLAI